MLLYCISSCTLIMLCTIVEWFQLETDVTSYLRIRFYPRILVQPDLRGKGSSPGSKGQGQAQQGGWKHCQR